MADSDQEALRTLLGRLHKQLVRRDVNGIFAKPVTDDIAPRYSELIANPMDLSTMRTKIDANQYGCVPEFRADFRLMCENAKTYNTPDTIFYAEADKLMSEGDVGDVSGGPSSCGSGDADGGGSGGAADASDNSSNMMVLVGEEDSADALMEIEELQPQPPQLPQPLTASSDDPGAAASYTDESPVGELTALAEAAAAEARARLLSAGPPLVGRLEEPGMVFVPVDDYEDYGGGGGLCRRQVAYPGDALRLLGLQEDERAALDQLTSRLNPTSGCPLLLSQADSQSADRVDALLAEFPEQRDLLSEVYGDSLALEYVLSVQSYIAECSRGQRQLVNKYLNLVTEEDHRRCEPLWREFRQRRLGLPLDEKEDLADEAEELVASGDFKEEAEVTVPTGDGDSPVADVKAEECAADAVDGASGQ